MLVQGIPCPNRLGECREAMVLLRRQTIGGIQRNYILTTIETNY